MNICMMTNTYLPHVGGVAQSVHTFAEEYRKQGHKALVVAPSFPGADSDSDEPGVVRLPAIQQFNGSDFSVRLPLTGMFNSAIDEFDANIIHSHHPFLLGDTALRVAARKHVPIIFTHHTRYEEYTHYVPFDSATLKQFTIELSTEYANLCDAVIAPSKSIAQLIQERGVQVPIEVIPTGVNVAALRSGNRAAARGELNLADDAFVVGHVGRLAHEKNLEFLSRAVCAFLHDVPQAVFLMIGSGPAGETVQATFEAAGLAKRLMLPGTRTGPELWDAYAAMDVFAFASLTETQGMVLTEAMAANLPVVALDACGSREVVRDGRNGFLLPADVTPSQFAERLRLLLDSADLRREMRASARRTASRFSSERMAAKALGLYEQIRLATRPARQAERDDTWAALLKRLEVEWSLLAEKTRAAVNAFTAEEPAAP